MGCMSERWWQRGVRAGRLLVATPEISDGVFRRSVVFLIEHTPGPEGGTLGVVLNRPTRTPVGAVLADWHDLMTAPSVLHEGGPVQRDGALCLGRLRPGAHGSAGAAGGAWVSDEIGPGDRSGVRPTSADVGLIDLDADAALIAPQVSALRVFAGHSGWGGGQLEAEVAMGSWYVVPAQPADLFSPEPELLWRTVLQRQPAPLSWVSTFPDDPSDN
jgi:putative transcriptional regulator